MLDRLGAMAVASIYDTGVASPLRHTGFHNRRLLRYYCVDNLVKK